MALKRQYKNKETQHLQFAKDRVILAIQEAVLPLLGLNVTVELACCNSDKLCEPSVKIRRNRGYTVLPFDQHNQRVDAYRPTETEVGVICDNLKTVVECDILECTRCDFAGRPVDFIVDRYSPSIEDEPLFRDFIHYVFDRAAAEDDPEELSA